MVLRVSRRDLLRCLTSGDSWAFNLPADTEIVSSRVDEERDEVALVIRSPTFPPVPKHSPLVEFVPEAAPPADCAPSDDRLMQLLVPEAQLAYRLGHAQGFRVTNLPLAKFEIVEARVDTARKGVVFVLRGPFPVVKRGAPIPQLAAGFQGLALAKLEGWD
jgi:hypothetical protein